MKRKAAITFFFLFILSLSPCLASEKVTLQLAWKHQFQFAGYYAARHKGYYAKAGLDVEIVEGGEGKFAREQVLNKNAQYGVAGAELVLHIKDGDPFVVLAPIFQHSPSVLLVRKDSGISNLQDLIKKRVMILPGKKDADILAAFLNEGIHLEAFIRLNQTYNLNDLIEKRTDAVSGYVTNEPYYLTQKGIEPGIISPQTYGVDFYSDCLFTTEKEVNANPERVNAFLYASLQGWEYAMANPTEIADLIINIYKVDKSRDHLLYEAESLRKLMLPDLVQIGHMNPGRWRHIIATYANLGMIDPDFSIEGFLYNPTKQTTYTAIKSVVIAAVLISIVMGIGALILYWFNRKLAKEVQERRQMERALVRQKEEAERYLSLAGVMFIGLDKNGNINLANKKACSLLEYSEEEIIGLDWLGHFIPKAVREEVRVVFMQLMAGKIGPVKYYENPVILKSGNEKTIAWYNSYLTDDHGQITGILSSGEDISEKRLLEAHLLNARKMESIGNLAGGIAHEFNNILSIIIGNNELIMDELHQESSARESAKEIQVAGIRARDVVRQLLTFSRQDKAVQIVLDTRSVVNASINLIRSSIPANIRIRPDLDQDVAPIIGNDTQINQIMINLCSNAADAMMDTGGQLAIRLNNISVGERSLDGHPGLKPGPYVKLTISDKGNGIDSATLSKIFEPYFTTKGIGKGTGIGLAVVHGIVERHSGSIAVESVPDKGTTFTILFPAYDSPVEQTREEEPELPKGNARVLFVDDEPAIEKLGNRLLTSLGYAVTSFTDPLDALKKFKAGPDAFDLIISDVSMPNMSGDQLIIEILAIRPGIPTIICTGYSAKISKKEASDIGVTAFLMKPLEKSELAATIWEALNPGNGSALN